MMAWSTWINTLYDNLCVLLLVSALVFGTIAGNILIFFAIAFNKRLQNVTNFFLMSLAVSDLMVALFVMPFGILTLISGDFPLTPAYCLAWICLDVFSCTASIMHLCAISIDRFLSLHYTMKFGRNKSGIRMIVKIFFVWILSAATCMPLPIMYSKEYNSVLIGGTCQIPDCLYRVIGSIICFCIPVTVMLLTHISNLRLLRKQKFIYNDFLGIYMSPSNLARRNIVIENYRTKKKNFEISRLFKSCRRGISTSIADQNFFKLGMRYNRRIQLERKATRVLTIIFVTFVLLWAPFFIINFTSALCPTCAKLFNSKIFNIALWLGYASSFVNPIFYTIFNKTFRLTFKNILSCRITQKSFDF